MHRDSLFWSAVGALALGTALLAGHGADPALAAGSTAAEPAHGRAPDATARSRPALADDRAMREAGGRHGATEASSPDRPRGAPEPSATQGTDTGTRRSAVRESLAELVRSSRQRAARAKGAGAVTLDPVTQMPLAEMSVEQFRAWAKLGTMVTLRDYRGVAELEPQLRELFDPTVVDAMLDATVTDYRAYLADVVEGGCEGLDPESVWRKTAFMTLFLGQLERRTAELGELEAAALRACDY